MITYSVMCFKIKGRVSTCTLTGDFALVLNLFLSGHHYGSRLSEQHTGEGPARDQSHDPLKGWRGVCVEKPEL